MARAPARSVLTLAALAALALPAVLTAPPAAEAQGQVPCEIEPAVCPDLIVDPKKLREFRIQTITFGSTARAVQEGSVTTGTHKLLRFTFTTPNLGPGDLYVGRPWEHPEWFTWGACHRHYHFKEYADYRLWKPEGFAKWAALRSALPTMTAKEVLATFPELQQDFVAGNKAGFCVIDLVPLTVVDVLGPKYRSCGDQGISVGWADEYHWGLDGQWVVIDNVAPGNYILEAEVNAERLYKETNYNNNLMGVPMKL